LLHYPLEDKLLKVLVIGSGGREHALAWLLARCPSVEKVYATPGNPGIADVAECMQAQTIDDQLAVAESRDVDLTVVGPEAPLVAGIVDRFRAAGKAIVGPTAAASRLEGSKAFSKDFMARCGIPTARYRVVVTIEEARSALDDLGFPVVLKADGLAAGKGVVIAHSRTEADHALRLLMGSRLVIEEFLEGEEVSFIVLSDGRTALPLQPSQDHKAVFDGDRGPNTGGMGAYSDSRILSAEESSRIMSEIIQPALDGMTAEGNPFTGFLYAGLMMTARGPKVLEFNARLGDPETQALVLRMNGDFSQPLLAAAHGDLAGVDLDWRPQPSVCVVLAAKGYPGEVRTGDVISGIEAAEMHGAVVFQAGTKATERGLVSSGGRVLGVTASGSDLRAAIANAYDAAHQIHFAGLHFRSDIGAKGLRRYAAEHS
jgi:phosphoribosylamine--glycine ligase